MKVDYTKGNMYKTIIDASVPTFIAFLLHSAFNIVDAYYVGKIDAQALAAVSLCFPIVFLIISLGSGIGIGATSVVARYLGAKDKHNASEAAKNAILGSFILGIVVMFIGIFGTPYVFDMMIDDAGLKQVAVGYTNIILAFSPIMLFAMVTNSVLRGEGDMKTPMYVMGGSAILNIILDPIFIFTLDLGVDGAAYATILSRFIGISYLVFFISRGGSHLSFNPKGFRFKKRFLKEVLVVGIPSSLSNLVMTAGMFAFTGIVSMYGVEAIAAFGIGFRLDSLALLPALGVMTAMISIVGQSIGAKKKERAIDATLKGGVIASAFMILLGACYYLFAEQIIRVFSTDPLVVEYGVAFLHIIPLTYLVVGFGMCFTGTFLGAGKANIALGITILRVLVFSVPLAYIFSQLWGLDGIWWGIFTGSYLAVGIGYTVFKTYKWYE